MNKKISESFLKIKEKSPFLHCIVGMVSVNFCANVALAIGAKPICAEYKKEIPEVTGAADALMLSLAGITKERKRALVAAAKTARSKKIPFVFDAVGVSCSSVRRRFAIRVIKKYKPDIIKGNYSEIAALYEHNYKSKGVDADPQITFDTALAAAKKLSCDTGCVVLASGKTDIIAGKEEAFFVNNGTIMLSHMTATGCALGTLAAAFLSVAPAPLAAVSACALLGVAGEISECKASGSFAVKVLDTLSTIKKEELCEMAKVEECFYE